MIQKFVLIGTMLMGAAPALCQTQPDQPPTASGAGIGLEMKQNAEALRQYSHKRRTAVSIKGQSRGARVDLVHYVDGKQETVPLETPSGQGQSRGRRGVIGGLIAENQKKDMKEDVERLTALMRRYTSLGSGSLESGELRAMLERASISRVGPDADLKAIATAVVEPTDTVTFTWSTANHRPETIEVRTTIGSDPVSATVRYASLPDGPFYSARTLISWPKKAISVTIDNYDYTRDAPPNGTGSRGPSY